MEYTTTHIVYFSPTHTSQKVARAIGDGIGMGRRIETDLTCNTAASEVLIKDSLVIIAAPVYAGRVAPLAVERLKRLKGDNSVAILVAVYGNRDYEDALVELRDLAINQGFTPFAACAFIGEHSYSRKGMPIAEGRPDDADICAAMAFGKEALEKLVKARTLKDVYPFYVKGNVPYKEVGKPTPAAPITLDHCAICGECMALCPTKAIFVNDEGKIDTDKMKCIKCCACVKECPAEAREFNTPYTEMLYKNFSARRDPETFL